MPHVDIVTIVSDRDGREMYELLCDTERYAQLTDAIESLGVERDSDTTAVSTWRVRFRSGILQWVEADVYDPELLTIAFAQLEGDFERFHGRWSVEPEPHGCRVHFTAEFDFGMPTLAPMIDPIAEAALREAVGEIVAALAAAPAASSPAAPAASSPAGSAAAPMALYAAPLATSEGS
jgi:ribosome-associated toxin RatA of RatAB toxin-antitoxin module